MMQFKEQKSIYLQIAEHLEEQILNGSWPDNERVPSIRDIAVQMEVNPNTVTRTYALLQEKGIIYNQRGIGYFTASDAREQVMKQRRTQFLTEELPQLFRTMDALKLSPEEILNQYSRSGGSPDSSPAERQTHTNGD